MLKKLAPLLLAAALFFAACQVTYEPERQPEEPLTFTEAEFPRVDGSTANIPLAEAAAAVLLGIDRADAARFADFSGTDRAFRSLLEDRADLLIVYGPSDETRQQFRVLGIDRLRMAPIGSDALVFIVNAENPVENLTTDQIRDIYAGIITNWSEVGGYDAPIAPFQRNTTAGSHAMMTSLLMRDTPLMTPPQIYIIGGMGEMIAAVAEFDSGLHAIGYNVFFYVSEMMRNPNIRILSVDGVAPSQETIRSGEYPLTNYFFAVIRPDEEPGSPAYQMFRWLLSAEGQALIELEGYAAVR